MRSLRLFSLVLLAAAVAACDSGPGGSLYDPDDPDNAAPVISSVSPQGVVLAGIDEITITGQNFSATPGENLVFFDDGEGNAARGTVLAASTTELQVKVPNLANPNLRVRVSVQGARDFSNAVDLPLLSAVVPFGDLDAGSLEDPKAIASGLDGTLYVTLYINNEAVGIRRLTPEGTRLDFSTQDFLWTGLAPTSDGALIAVRQDRGIYRIPEGTTRATFGAVPSGNILRTIVRGSDDAYWVGGSHTTPSNANLYRVAGDGSTMAFPFSEPVRALAVAGGALYVATAKVESSIVTSSKVWRFPFDEAGGLGDGSVLYDVTADRGVGVGANALAIAADGTVYVGTNETDPVLEISPEGSASVLYPGVLPSPIVGLAWSSGTKLYALQGLTPAEVENGGVADLFTIETRRQSPL